MRPGSREEEGGPDPARRVEKDELERGRLEPGEEPTDPAPAATVVVARPDAGGMSVLLLRRPRESRFAAGAYVFPGGRVDPDDGTEETAERVTGVADGVEAAALVAGVRELFEEAGLLLTRPRLSGAEAREARRRLQAGEVTFGRLAERHGLRVPAGEIVYFARWITPRKLRHRYDARFFLARHPGGEVEPGTEHTEAVWVAPGEALRRFEAGQLPMLFPTRKAMEVLAEYRGVEAAMTSLRARKVEPVLPRLIVEGEEVVPVLPGDPRYGAEG